MPPTDEADEYRGRHETAGIRFELIRERMELDPQGRDVVYEYTLKADDTPIEIQPHALLDFELTQIRFLEDGGVLLPEQLRGQWRGVVNRLFDDLRPVREAS